MTIIKRHYAIFLMLTLIGFGILPAAVRAQDTPPETPCQAYRLTVDQGRVRAEPGETAPIIGGVNRLDTLCIQGVADNDLPWLVIKLEDSDGNFRQGFISSAIVEPGEPGQSTNPFDYCDAWQILPEEAIVRAGPSTTFGIVETYHAGDTLCLDDYVYLYKGWSSITVPATGVSGWVDTGTLVYEYDESLGCVDDSSYIVESTAALFTCPGRGCSTQSSVASGSKVCVNGESEEDLTWVSFVLPDSGGRNGWIVMDLLEPAELEDEGVAQVATTTATTRNATTVTRNATTATSVATATRNVIISTQTSTSRGTPTPTVFVSPTITPTSTPDGELPVVAPICPVGAQPLNAGACVTVTPTPLPGLPELVGNGVLLARDVALSQFFVPNSELVSPQGSLEFFFRLPDDWVLGAPTTLFLNVDYNESFTALDPNTNTAGLSSRFDVRVDGILVSTLTLNTSNIGIQTLEIPIPDAIIQDPEVRSHSVSFTLSARDYCQVNAETRLAIDATASHIRFVYEEAQPVLDFIFYPIPFFNFPIGSETESVIIVLPENPSDEELQAAASVAGGLGKLTGDALKLQFSFDTQLSPEEWQTHNIILIGKVDKHHQIRDLYRRDALPSSWDGETLSLDDDPLATDDGLMQLAFNPDNLSHALLVITGQSDLAVARAGLALGGKPSIFGIAGDASVIVESRPLFRTTEATIQSAGGIYSFGELNDNENIVLNGVGVQFANIDFDVPLGGPVREDAYLELTYNSTTLLDGANSTLTMAMNDVPIASTNLQRNVIETQTGNNELVTSEGFRTLRVSIPASLPIPGETNQLTILATLDGDWECDIPEASSIWVTLSKDSFLFIPQEQSTDEILYPQMVQFPRPYNVIPNLSDVVISMPEQVTEIEGQQLIEMVSYLADATRFGEGFQPVIIRGELPEDFVRGDYHYIVFGRPSTNAFLRELNSLPPMVENRETYLPQPFVDDTDELQQIYDDVSYRLRDNIAVGVMQVVESPWNPQRRVTILSGTTPLGQLAASQALLNLSFGRVQLFGDVVFATFSDAYPVDTRNVFDPREILSVAPEALPAVGVPSPTPILVGSGTPIIVTSTPELPTPNIFITATPEPSLTPTAAPTLPPLVATPTDATAKGTDWILIVIGISVVIVIVGGAYTIYSELRPKKKDTTL